LIYGAVAAGHDKTAEAAALMLREGGNAFDAVLAALCSACVAEPVLASLGGGGFLLARPADAEPVLYDFFVQTPRRKRALSEVDFRPIMADFGDAQQEFHIGLGAAATPGVVKGLFLIHRELCRLPLEMLLHPARELAGAGTEVNRLQHYIATIVEPILRATPQAFALHQAPDGSERLAAPGERTPQPAFADALTALAAEGEELFYRGDMGQTLVRGCREHGGYLTREDLELYRMEKRRPLRLDYRGALLLTNPPPALGGLLIGFTLALMRERTPAPAPWGSTEQLLWTARAMELTQRMRARSGVHEQLHELEATHATIEELSRDYLELMREHPPGSRGTTQVSILDRDGNLASMTLSNGEGCGCVLPGTGIMINNMLGEEDVNPHGFHQWPEDRRIASMMAPSALLLEDGSRMATGSGGSNRIRSAVLQVVSNLVDYGMDVKQAVTAPRIHFESGLLNLEPPRPAAVLQELSTAFPEQCMWNDHNLFFGGAHSVLRRTDGELEGAGDPRRGGVYRLVSGAA
jgi:gamma-glutamyltranspeptidase/glutathione hydrolase